MMWEFSMASLHGYMLCTGVWLHLCLNYLLVSKLAHPLAICTDPSPLLFTGSSVVQAHQVWQGQGEECWIPHPPSHFSLSRLHVVYLLRCVWVVEVEQGKAKSEQWDVCPDHLRDKLINPSILSERLGVTKSFSESYSSLYHVPLRLRPCNEIKPCLFLCGHFAWWITAC